LVDLFETVQFRSGLTSFLSKLITLPYS